MTCRGPFVSITLCAGMVLAVAASPAEAAAVTGERIGDPAVVVPEDAETADFGGPIDLDGTTMVVGSPSDSPGGQLWAGSAYVFERVGEGWQQQAKLVVPDLRQQDRFGTDVAVSGDTIVVGADDYGPDSGAAYVFVRSGSTWVQQAQLLHPAPARGDHFGMSVDIDGDTIVVGAYRDDYGGLDKPGTVQVFLRSGDSWTAQREVRAPDDADDVELGSDVALQGDTMLVGAASADTELGVDAGAAYAFRWTGQRWRPTARLADTAGSRSGHFGTAVALDDGTAVIGDDPFSTGTNPDRVMSVFVLSGASWAPQGRLTTRSENDEFGRRVDVQGDTVVVSAATYTGTEERQGAAYVFSRTDSSWDRGRRLLAPDPEADGTFGGNVALDVGRLAVSADVDDEARVLVYDIG